jgi:hypothetical protein
LNSCKARTNGDARPEEQNAYVDGSTVKKTLYRAANDDYVNQGFSFATNRTTAEAYLDNPGFGGASIFRCRIDVPEEQVIDLTNWSVRKLAKNLGFNDPGAIGLDEWLPRTPSALDTLREKGYLWALVAESFPHETTTWIWLGTSEDNEPELIELNG